MDLRRPSGSNLRPQASSRAKVHLTVTPRQWDAGRLLPLPCARWTETARTCPGKTRTEGAHPSQHVAHRDVPHQGRRSSRELRYPRTARGACHGMGWSMSKSGPRVQVVGRTLHLKQEAGRLRDSKRRSRETARSVIYCSCLKGLKIGVYLFIHVWGHWRDMAQLRRPSSFLRGHRIPVWERTTFTQSPGSLGGRPCPRHQTR